MIRSERPLAPRATDPHSAMRDRRWQRRLLRQAGVADMADYAASVRAEIDRQTAA